MVGSVYVHLNHVIHFSVLEDGCVGGLLNQDGDNQVNNHLHHLIPGSLGA